MSRTDFLESPVAIPLSDRSRILAVTGLSSETIRRRHLDSGLPLRFIPAGAYRKAVLVLKDFERWLAKQDSE